LVTLFMKAKSQTALPIDYSEALPSVSWEEFQKVVSSRRSIQVFKNERIPKEIIHSSLDAALLAPNPSNLQPWEFYWVKTARRKKRLIEYCINQPAAKTAAELIVCVGRKDTWRRNRQEMLRMIKNLEQDVPEPTVAYYEKLVPLAFYQGPFGIFGKLKKIVVNLAGYIRPIPQIPVDDHDIELWAMRNCAMACENLMLALRAHGYDSCPLTTIDTKRISKYLELPSDAFVVMVVACGRRKAKDGYGPRVRFARKWFVKEV
jgi:nitroreductase